MLKVPFVQQIDPLHALATCGSAFKTHHFEEVIDSIYAVALRVRAPLLAALQDGLCARLISYGIGLAVLDQPLRPKPAKPRFWIPATAWTIGLTCAACRWSSPPPTMNSHKQ